MIKCLERERDGLSGTEGGLKTYILVSKLYFLFGVQAYSQFKKVSIDSREIGFDDLVQGLLMKMLMS